MNRDDLLAYLDEYLATGEVEDFGPNGLQVEGRGEVSRLVTGVSASAELFGRAKELEADGVLVHHGIFWQGQDPVVKGGYRERLRLLLEAGINLLAYHLPLDRHPEVGNNAVSAQALGLEGLEPFGEYRGITIGYRGRLPEVEKETLFELIGEYFGGEPLVFDFGPDRITSAGIISGAAQGQLGQAVAAGLDCYITGEASEYVMHQAKEAGIHFVAAGHYRTERPGVLALGDHLAERFGLEVEFVEIPNPV